MVLEVEQLTKIFRGPAETVTALDQMSFSLQKGEFVAVVGPSGCGKTTLLLTAGALLRPTSGIVRIGHADPYALSPECRARFRAQRIGFVFQQFHLVPYLTVLENILAPALARPLDNARDRAMALARRFNLEHRIGHVPSALSTGERQRTALARALLHEPELILADEPTGSLDKANAETVMQHLADMAKAGKAVLMVTHDDTASSHVHRTLRIDHGRLV